MTLHTRLENICGSTPLIKISDRVYGKLETYSPTGSVKDRFVTYVVKNALVRGDINEHTILCEATSGNTGISLSAIAASLGLQCIIFMPENMSEERRQMMLAYGAQIVNAPASDFQGAIDMRNSFIDRYENAWSPMQFSNPENVQCHMTITGPEIAKQAGPAWAAFVHRMLTSFDGVLQTCFQA
jgi:cysteine synthase A